MIQGVWDPVLLCRPGTTDEAFMLPLLTSKTLLIVFLLHEGEEDLEMGQCYKGKLIRHTEMLRCVRIIYAWD